LEQKTENDIRLVMVRAKAADGRQTDEMGAVPVIGLKGADLANAYMKAITKAKRRAVLSLCGLGMMDETELETVPRVATPTPGVVRMPEPIGPAEPDPEPAEIEVELPVQEQPPTEVVKTNQIVIVPTKIIPEKNPAGGFIYNVYDSGGQLWVTKFKPDALTIKTAIESKARITMSVDGNMIQSVDVPF
jgi:hypothetical protein